MCGFLLHMIWVNTRSKSQSWSQIQRSYAIFFCTCQLIVWSVSRYDVCGTEYKRICGYLIGLMFNWEKTFNYYYLTLPIHVCFYLWIELIFLFICVFWFHTSYGHRRLNVNTKLRNENDKKFLYWLCISGL